MSLPIEPAVPSGFVSLVGAGPGHPDLITLRGLRALQRADVILEDALLDPRFQDLFPATAIRTPVGKRCGQAPVPQERIHALLREHALQGRRVVRLKGGDPLLFGRGGEEARFLEREGIPFEIIPGVSALQGAAAASGIPLTLREVSRELRVLEGQHLLDPGTDWGSLARGDATLAIFMGSRRLAEIAAQLLRSGADPERPVALVEAASCAGQQTTISTLRLVADGHLRPCTGGPGIVYIGAVVRHRSHPIQPQDPHTHVHEPAAPVPRSAGKTRAAGGRRERRAS